MEAINVAKEKEILKWHKATIGQVFRGHALAYFREGRHQNQDVTFNLGQWASSISPQRGQVVELAEIQLFDGGWRANVARPIVLEE